MCLFVLKIHTATIKAQTGYLITFFWILFYINKHNRQMNTMMWQGSGILAPRDDIKWRKRKVILHKSCPIGNGGSTPPIIAKHCGVEQLVACQAQYRITHCEEFTELTFWVSHSFNYEMSSTLIFSTNLEVVGSSPTPATKKIQNIFINIWIFQIFLLYLYC